MKYFVETKALSIWGHAQNLNKYGSMWREGRAWLHVSSICFGLSWYFFGRSSTAMDIELGGEEEFKFHIALYRLFALWFTISQILPRKWTRNWKWWDWTWGRQFGFSIHDGYFWFGLFQDTMDSGNNRHFWQEFNFNYMDFLLGSQKHSKELLESGEALVPMVEGVYPVNWEKWLHTWKRSRGRTRRIIRYNLELPTPIPVPGKGENSWDLDDDAIESASYPVGSLSEAIGQLVASVLRTRERYGWSKDRAQL